MDANHMVEIVQNLIEYVLTNTKFDKCYVRERLSEMGWTDFDLKYFNADWMFEEVGAMTKPDTTTYDGVRKFFEQCKAFWRRQGNSEAVATSKAFWWDCVECFNFDKSWNDAKRQFALEFRGYHPGDAVPDEKLVMEGKV